MAPINLADPGFEPTDSQLVALSKSAFGDLKARRDRLREIVRARVLELKTDR